MHELSVAEDILDLVGPRVDGRHRLCSVHLTVGPLSGICADALVFCFPELAELRGLGRPELVIYVPPVQARCADCGCDYTLNQFSEGCPGCGSSCRDIENGGQFTVDWIEVEDS